MATSELLSLWEAADLLGIRRFALTNCRPYLQDFPAPVKGPGKTLLYRQDEVKAWAKGRDVKAELKAAYRVRRQGVIDEQPAADFNATARGFISGQFLPASKRNALEFKKLVARTTKPKTTRIQLVHDWMLEDGPRATHRRAS